MTKVIDQFTRDMQIRNLAQGTQVRYLLALRNLSKHYNHTPPEDLTDLQVQNYIHYLSCDQNYSWSHVHVQTSAFRFFYGHTLHLSETWTIQASNRP